MRTQVHPKTKLVSIPRLGKDYLLCKNSGVIYYTKAKAQDDYEEDYFFKDYKLQYGKNYIEDESYLRLLARRRLKKLEEFFVRFHKKRMPFPTPKLYELGSAFGFFLDEAKKSKIGWEVGGIEISKIGCNYSLDTFGIHVRNSDFLQEKIEEESLSAFCAFYVIEHFKEQKTVFEKISKSLKKGGLFSFALPSTFGPLYHFNKTKWKDTHPNDHFADYSPQSLSKTLALYQMRLLKTWPSSYHQERLPKLYSKIIPPSLYKTGALLLSYGDTFEGIAIKI